MYFLHINLFKKILLSFFVIGVFILGCKPTSINNYKLDQQSVGADDFEIGAKAASIGDYKTAFRYWEPIGNLGNIKAQHNLGVLYNEGLGVSQDYLQAMIWYQLAAQQGYMNSQNNIGVLYDKGRGVSFDYSEAFKWFKLAADQGFPNAYFNIGSMYEAGRGVKQDYNEAVKWYKLAVDQGDAQALNNLGSCFNIGLGVSRDIKEATRLYILSANKGNSDAQYNLGLINLDNHHDNEAINWFAMAARQGNKKAQTDLAMLYLKGNLVPKNFLNALDYFKLAAEQGDDVAQYNLALMYLEGLGVDKDHLEAMKWLQKAANQGQKEAKAILESELAKMRSLGLSTEGFNDGDSGFGMVARKSGYKAHDERIDRILEKKLQALLADNPIMKNYDNKRVIFTVELFADGKNSIFLSDSTGNKEVDNVINEVLPTVQLILPQNLKMEVYKCYIKLKI